ncbi:MAG: TonB-dependent receptor family protein [Bacteroidales bacterium]|nr:TonB-dependent receptor family protein [Bacteroidales bacterium]
MKITVAEHLNEVKNSKITNTYFRVVVQLLFFCVLVFGHFFIIKGQSIMNGYVMDGENRAITDALVMVLSADENLFSSEITDSTGMFAISLPANLDNYYLYLNSFGFSPQKMILKDAEKLQIFVLEGNVQSLEAVIVTVSRPAIIREVDKFVIPQIYNSPLAQGKNIMDFLGYAPLLKVNLEGYLEVLGKGRTTIYVNGRKSNIDLQGVPAENIEKVEIIPFPGSQYPATERNGIVNIVLRKPLEDGVLTNITVRDQQKEKWILNNPSLNLFLNIQKKKINITTGVSTSYFPSLFEESGIHHYFLDGMDMYYTKNNYFTNYYLNVFFNLDYNINKKHSLGFRIQANTNYRKEKNSVETNYRFLNSSIIDSSDFTESLLKMNAPNYSVSSNLNYNITFNAKQKLSFDWDYNHYLSDMPHYFQHTLFSDKNPVFSDFRTQATISLDGYGVKTRFQHNFNSDIELNVGLECYGAVVDYNYFYGNKLNNIYVSDSLRTNDFIYKDITGSAYIDFNWEISDKWSLSTGLRGEYYIYKGVQQVTREVVSNKYPNIFPSLSVYYVPHEDHELGLNFTTNYVLPSYSMLNPFRFFYSPNFYQENNPYLKPCKSYSLALEYTFFSDYMFVFEYEFSKDSWSDFRIPVGNGVTKIKTMNYGENHDFWFTFSITKNLFKNFLYLSFNADLSYFIARNIPSEIVTYNETGINFISTDLKINTALNKKKNWRIETRFQFCPRSKGVSLEKGATYYLSASISKSFKNSTLSFGVNDIIDKPINISFHGETFAYGYERFMYGRTYWISYNIKFGNNKARGVVNRNSDKIQQRIQN